jgi:hypothetical protein
MHQEFLSAMLWTAMALCAAVTVVLSFVHWKDRKDQKREQDDGQLYLVKAKPLLGSGH